MLRGREIGPVEALLSGSDYFMTLEGSGGELEWYAVIISIKSVGYGAACFPCHNLCQPYYFCQDAY